MKHRIATIAAAALLLGGATIASTASARDSWSVSFGVPGFAVGYGNRGYYAPPVVYAPPVAYAPYSSYYYDAPVAYGAPVVYGPRFVYGRPYYRPYRPYYHARYWHP